MNIEDRERLRASVEAVWKQRLQEHTSIARKTMQQNEVLRQTLLEIYSAETLEEARTLAGNALVGQQL